MSLQIPYAGGWTAKGNTAAGGTAFFRGIQPTPPGRQSLYTVSGGVLNPGVSTLLRVNTVCYTTGLTAHAINILRPLNWTTLTAATAANGTVLNLAADPGVYSTNYRYSVPGSLPVTVADNAIAANDYLAVQLKDGLFHFTKVTSVSTLAITITTALPNITGGGAASGAVVYFFGVAADSDPATGLAHPGITIPASQTADKSWSESNVGTVGVLHYGDPLLFLSPNTTDAGVLEFMSGYFSKY